MKNISISLVTAVIYFDCMQVFSGVANRPRGKGPVVLTIGNFDGVHLGHQALISRVRALATEKKIQGGVLTFNPHPAKVLAPERNTQSLFPLDDRVAALKSLGVDFVIVEPFSRELSELEPEEFFKKLLIEKLQVQHLIVGHDFNFGRDRSGTAEVLRVLASKYKVALEILNPVKVRGEIVSSSKIRGALVAGDVEWANAMLGRPFSMSGVIERGAGRGRKIGFPTANLYADGEMFPREGVYVTWFEIGNQKYKSVTNVGRNPTFDEKTKRPVQVETYIFDFDRDIYGEQAKVYFLKYLRPEMKFDSVKKLIEKIHVDVDEAKRFLWPVN